MTSIARRSLLGLGGSLLLTTLARRVFSDGPLPPPKRLVLLMQNNGTQQASFWPGATFSSPILAPLLDDPKIAAKTSLVKGIFLPRDANGTNGNEHDMGFARMFTGEKLKGVGGQPWGGGPSVDQIVARAWGVESLTLAILASSVEPAPKPGFDHRRSFSYVGPAAHKLPTLDPLDAYSLLFADAKDPNDADARQRLLLRKSALDAVVGNLTEARSELGRDRTEILDLHLAAVRDLELRLVRSRDGTGARCPAKPVAPRNFHATPRLLVDDESAVPELMTDMLDLIAAAIGCGATRVATLQMGFAGGKWKFGWEGINMELHGEIAHKDTSDAGSSPENTARLVKANRYYASQVAYLARKLGAMPEGDGTVLDHTLVVWANELGRGDHDLNNLPVVLIGGPAGVLPRGRLVDAGPQTFQRMGCTVLRAMGIDARGFGDAPDCGPLRGA